MIQSKRSPGFSGGVQSFDLDDGVGSAAKLDPGATEQQNDESKQECESYEEGFQERICAARAGVGAAAIFEAAAVSPMHGDSRRDQSLGLFGGIWRAKHHWRDVYIVAKQRRGMVSMSPSAAGGGEAKPFAAVTVEKTPAHP